MVQRDLLNAGREATAKAQERLETLLDDLSKAAQEQRDQVQQMAQELIERSQRSSEQLVKVVDREIRAQIANLGLATKADIKRLEKKIENLQKAQAPKKAAAKKAPAKKAAKASTAKKAAKKA